ncbi:MAG: D-glycerate dehydrogenase [Alphaproteobacteria bacterium]|nr:D-glycerate dehydrogenase [Alphaproteobacteria bacterium]
MTDKPKILVTRRHLAPTEARLTEDYDVVLNEDDHIMSADEIVAAADGMDALLICVTEPLDAAAIERLPDSVRAILTLSVGLDHVDTAAAKARGLAVLNTPDAVTDPTAEIGMLLLLGAARRAAEGAAMMRAGEWSTWSPRMMIGKEITGSPLGILGMGRIGQTVAARARGFDMTIRYHNRTRLPFAQEASASYYTTPEGLLEASPFLLISAPSTPETRGFLNAERIAMLPDGAIVVNIARGELVDDDALVAALGSGKVAAAGLDVFNGEPADIHPGYFELPNVFMTPHIGSGAERSRAAMGDMLLDGLDLLLAGEPVPNRVV